MKTITDHRIDALDDLTARFASGYLRFYDGTKPTRVSSALGGGNHILAELRYASTAFAGAAADGSDVVTATAGTITDGVGTSAAGSGTTTTFASAFASNGTTRLADFTVSVTSGDIVLDSLTIVEDVTVHVASQVITNPDGT